jgi:hypothetical protein
MDKPGEVPGVCLTSLAMGEMSLYFAPVPQPPARNRITTRIMTSMIFFKRIPPSYSNSIQCLKKFQIYGRRDLWGKKGELNTLQT